MISHEVDPFLNYTTFKFEPGDFDLLREFKGKPFCFNNLVLKLPDDRPPEISGEPKVRSGYSRRAVLKARVLDQVLELSSREGRLHSPLFLGQTPRQFFLAIDEAIDELELGPLIARYFRSLDEFGSQSFAYGDVEYEIAPGMTLQLMGERWRAQLDLDMVPLYVCLRRKGYSWFDLTS